MLKAFFAWLFGWETGPTVSPPVPDAIKDTAAPRPDIAVVSPNISAPSGVRSAWYMQPAMITMLSEIARYEAGSKGYDANYRNDDKWVLRNYTLDEVIKLAKSQVAQGEASSAIGRYQFLSATLESLRASLRLSGLERFSNMFQDDLAIALMIRRGLLDYVRGTLSTNSFMLNLAKEWASLPIPYDMKRNGRLIRRGQSYYAGDGLNKAFHSVEAVEKFVTALKTQLRAHAPASILKGN